MSTTAPAEAAPPGAEATDLYTKIVIAVFFVTVFIPGSFYVGVRMTPFRLFLILMAVPMVLRYRADPTLRVTSVDVFVFLAIAWRSLAILANHQTTEILNAVAFFIELFFGYMLGRVFIRSAEDYRWFFRCFLVTLIAFLPFALAEFATRQRVLRNIFGFLVQPPLEVSSPQIRFGFMRVQASFNHAIHFGVFCALGFANLYYLYGFPRNYLYAGFSAFMALLAISSSSVLMLGVQGALMLYEIVLRFLRSKWIILTASTIFIWYGFQLVMGKTIIDYIVTELVYSQAGAEGRIDQVIYGLREIAENPFFGIGLDEPSRPFWRGHAIDNFWLATALRYGIAAFVFVILAFGIHFLRAAFAEGLDAEARRIRTGYMIAYASLMLFLGGLNIYGVMLVVTMAYFGAGAWLYDRAAPPERRRPLPPGRPVAPAAPVAPPAPPAPVPARPAGMGTGGARPRPSTGPYRAGPVDQRAPQGRASRSTTLKPPSGAGSSG